MKFIQLTEKESKRECWVKTASIQSIAESFPEEYCCVLIVEGRDVFLEVLGTAANVARDIEECIRLDEKKRVA